MCPDHTGLLESRELLQIASHTFSVLILPVNVWGIYCIFKKTPKSMKPVKWHLLNMHIWTSLFDLMCGSLVTPFFFFPALAGAPSGLLSIFGIPTLVQICLAFCAFGGVSSGIIYVFENRQYVLCENTTKFRLENSSTRLLYYSFVFAYCGLSIYPFAWNIPEQITAKLRILEEIPCPNPEFFSTNTYVFKDPEGTVVFAYFGLCFTVFLASQITFFGGQCFYNLYAFENVNLSAHSKRLQKKFFITICIQIFIPMWVIILPMSYMLFSLFSGYYSQSLNNVTSLLFSCHGFIATMCLLMMNPPYRSATWRSVLNIVVWLFPRLKERLEAEGKRVKITTSFVVSTVVK